MGWKGQEMNEQTSMRLIPSGPDDLARQWQETPDPLGHARPLSFRAEPAADEPVAEWIGVAA